MRKMVVFSLALASLGLGSNAVRAGGCLGTSCAECIPACTVSWVEKTVACYRPEWKERDVTCTVMRPNFRDEVRTQTCTVLVPEWKDVKSECWAYNLVPRQVTREVTCCRMVPTMVTDSCTGCCYTVCKPESFVQQVSCTVWDRVPVKNEHMVRVCSYKPEQKSYQVNYRVCEYKPEAVTRRERYCVMVPYQATVKVPVFTPVCYPPVCRN